MNKKIEEAVRDLARDCTPDGVLTRLDEEHIATCLAVIEAEMERIRMEQMLMDWIGAASAAESEGE